MALVNSNHDDDSVSSNTITFSYETEIRLLCEQNDKRRIDGSGTNALNDIRRYVLSNEKVYPPLSINNVGGSAEVKSYTFTNAADDALVKAKICAPFRDMDDLDVGIPFIKYLEQLIRYERNVREEKTNSNAYTRCLIKLDLSRLSVDIYDFFFKNNRTGYLDEEKKIPARLCDYEWMGIIPIHSGVLNAILVDDIITREKYVVLRQFFSDSLMCDDESLHILISKNENEKIEKTTYWYTPHQIEVMDARPTPICENPVREPARSTITVPFINFRQKGKLYHF